MEAFGIFGIGIDLVEIERIAGSIEEFGDRFLERVFTPAERGYCEAMSAPARHYAARFAAKEAVAKALGTGVGAALGWRDMEIVRDGKGAPGVVLSGRGKEFAEREGIARVLVSMSHDRGHAVAQAVALRG